MSGRQIHRLDVYLKLLIAISVVVVFSFLRKSPSPTVSSLDTHTSSSSSRIIISSSSSVHVNLSSNSITRDPGEAFIRLRLSTGCSDSDFQLVSNFRWRSKIATEFCASSGKCICGLRVLVRGEQSPVDTSDMADVKVNFIRGSESVSEEGVVLAQSSFFEETFRPLRDIVIPPAPDKSIYFEWRSLNSSGRVIPITYFKPGIFGTDPESALVQIGAQHQLIDYMTGGSVTAASHQLSSSVFVLLFPGEGFPEQLSLSLRFGAVPIIVDDGTTQMPYSEVLDWKRALYTISPREYKIELKKILDRESSNARTLFSMQRQGMRLYKAYFCTKEVILDTVLAIIRQRAGIMPPPHKPVVAINALTGNPFLTPQNITVPSSVQVDLGYRWNDAFYPWKTIPGEFELHQQLRQADFYRIKGEAPAQCTIVCMIYSRWQKLGSFVKQFRDWENINAVVIVWNNVKREPPPELKENLADLGVPVHVVKADRNSLNNRMVPYDIIQTDCVIQMDDDTRDVNIDLTVQANKVWKENQDNLVGFMARYANYKNGHAGYHYTGTTPKMLLTQLLYHHKYYSYLYTYEMDQSILDMVDQMINGEDIFLNALVQDLTGRPVLMPRRKSGFSCGTACGGGLHSSKGHLTERTKCVRKAIEVFGYMPFFPIHYSNAPLKGWPMTEKGKARLMKELAAQK